MNRRSFFSFLAAGVVVLLLIGISGYFWIVSQSPLTLHSRGSKTDPAAAMFVSKQAPVMVSLLVNPDKLESLQQLATRYKQGKTSLFDLDELKTSLLANTGLDYRRDIQPWLGEEITLAVTSADFDRDESNGKQPGYLMVLSTKDPTKSREFLQLLFSKRAIAGRNLVSEQYKGVNLISDTVPVTIADRSATKLPKKSTRQTEYLAGGVVGDRVLFANHPKVLREAINNVQATDLNLTSSSQYQQALTLLPSQQIGVAFLNLKSVVEWLQKQPQSLTYTSQIVSLELNRQGLLAHTSFIASPEQETASVSMSQPLQALKYIPDNTGLSISGSNLSNSKKTDLYQLWTQVTAVLSGSGNDAISRLVTQPLAKLQSDWGIDLDKDIFSWVEGEYAIGMLPHTDASAPDWIFVAEKTDAAEQGIADLNAIATDRGLSITPLSLGEQKIYAWTQLTTTPTNDKNSDRALLTIKAKVEGVQANLGNYEILTTSVEAMDAAIIAVQNGSLIDDAQFQPTVKMISQPNQGYIYLDWQKSREVLERQVPILKLLSVAGKPFFDNLRSLTISSYGSQTGVIKGSIFFQLKSAPRD